MESSSVGFGRRVAGAAAAAILVVAWCSVACATDALLAIGGDEPVTLSSGKNIRVARGTFQVYELKGQRRRPADGGISYDVLDATGRPETITNGNLFVRKDVKSMDEVRTLASKISARSWPPMEKRQVLEGYVDLGMSPEEVEMAWGPPYEIQHQGRKDLYKYSGTELVVEKGAVTEIH